MKKIIGFVMMVVLMFSGLGLVGCSSRFGWDDEINCSHFQIDENKPVQTRYEGYAVRIVNLGGGEHYIIIYTDYAEIPNEHLEAWIQCDRVVKIDLSRCPRNQHLREWANPEDILSIYDCCLR